MNVHDRNPVREKPMSNETIESENSSTARTPERYTEAALTLPLFISADPKLIRDAFDHEEFLFELKMDGFRGLRQISLLAGS